MSLGYFYYKKYQLNNLYGPGQITLICLQTLGLLLIGINFYMNASSKFNETYLFFIDNQKYFTLGYLFSTGFCFVLLLSTIIIIICKKRKVEIYNVLSESKI